MQCSILATRSCPRSYGEDGCGDRLCARFESDDETPWRADGTCSKPGCGGRPAGHTGSCWPLGGVHPAIVVPDGPACPVDGKGDAWSGAIYPSPR